MAGHNQAEFLSWGHGVRCVDPHILQHRAAGYGASHKTSESDRVGSRSRDGSIMGGSLFDALSFQIGGDGVQDCQQLGSVSGTVQESGSKVAGHGRMLVWFGKGGDGQRSAIISFISWASMAALSHATPSPVPAGKRPIMPFNMQRWNFSQGVSQESQNATHAFAVL